MTSSEVTRVGVLMSRIHQGRGAWNYDGARFHFSVLYGPGWNGNPTWRQRLRFGVRVAVHIRDTRFVTLTIGTGWKPGVLGIRLARYGSTR